MIESWAAVMDRYKRTIEYIQDWNPDPCNLIQRLPSVPLEYSPSPEGAVAIQLALFAVEGCVLPAKQISLSFIKLWNEGLLIGSSLLVRLSMELWGAIHYAVDVIKKMQQDGDTVKAGNRSQQLLTGARSPVQLPWGGYTDDKSIHILDMIRALKDIYPDAMEIYEFLSESCHPSYLMLVYWAMANPLGNWGNKHYQEHMNSLLERTLGTMKDSLEGISSGLIDLFDRALPIIDADRQGV